MAYDGWITYGDTELINLSRTAQLCEVLGIDALWINPESVSWIETALSGVDYGNVATAPWYDADYTPSAEFAGIVPIAITGLDDSSREASTVEYVTDGGSSGKPRNKTKPLVANVAIMASTNRGAEFGKRWLDRVLAGGGSSMFCSGSTLTYFAARADEGKPLPAQAHYRDVSVTRGTSVTRKTSRDCSVVWIVTFTFTANDPFEYGPEVPQFTGLGGAVSGPAVVSGGSEAFVEYECPVYDYTPVYDPLYPALVAAPSAPDFYPDGWDLLPGVTIDRFFVRTSPVEPSSLNVVPVFTLSTDVAARMVRISVWETSEINEAVCDPLWQAVVSYLPAGLDFVIDGEQQAAYVWDGVSPQVRRSDTLLYSGGARPMDWVSFTTSAGLLVTLDLMSSGSGDYDGDGTVRLDMSLVSKSN